MRLDALPVEEYVRCQELPAEEIVIAVGKPPRPVPKSYKFPAGL